MCNSVSQRMCPLQVVLNFTDVCQSWEGLRQSLGPEPSGSHLFSTFLLAELGQRSVAMFGLGNNCNQNLKVVCAMMSS